MSKKLEKDNLTISVVIPCYNEAETLKTVLESVRDCGLKTQIIVVDDGSTDGSRELLAGELKPYVDKILFHKSNLLTQNQSGSGLRSSPAGPGRWNLPGVRDWKAAGSDGSELHGSI